MPWFSAGIVGQADETTAALLDILRGIAPGSTVNVIRGPIEELTTWQTAGCTLAIGIVGAFWTASGYVRAFARAMWLWILNVSLLFGAEFDAETERARELQGGFKAEVTIQLPPRDTKKSDKLQRQEEEEIRRGRELRENTAPVRDLP